MGVCRPSALDYKGVPTAVVTERYTELNTAVAPDTFFSIIPTIGAVLNPFSFHFHCPE